MFAEPAGFVDFPRPAFSNFLLTPSFDEDVFERLKGKENIDYDNFKN